MFGGFHLNKDLWKTKGDFLEWPCVAQSKSDILISGDHIILIFLFEHTAAMTFVGLHTEVDIGHEDVFL